MAEKASLLSQVAGFSRDSLKHVDTVLTTHDGKKVIESFPYSSPSGMKAKGQQLSFALFLPSSSLPKFLETRDPTSGEVRLEEAGEAPSFVIDSTPDKVAGVAAKGLLVGSQDLAYDFKLLTELRVTHILNVAYGVPNAFPNVRPKSELLLRAQRKTEDCALVWPSKARQGGVISVRFT